MDELDPTHLAETLGRLLAGRELRLAPDGEGWFSLPEVCDVASLLLERTVMQAQVEHAGTHAGGGGARFEIVGARIRCLQRSPIPRMGPGIPDVLFHATTSNFVEAARAEGGLVSPRRRLLLSADESHAWRVAHRLAAHSNGQGPAVLAVDVARARRAGLRFQRARHGGLYSVPHIPLTHIISLKDGFEEQHSAGGIPVRLLPDGTLQVALVRVMRRSGSTWEVAKGKLEPGETPEQAAIREVKEEMGTAGTLDVLRFVGPVRYCFTAPGGLPRLKTVFLYLLHARTELEPFTPARREGIGEVAWFTVDDAAAAVTHPSLIPMMRRARDLLARYGISADPGLSQPWKVRHSDVAGPERAAPQELQGA